MIPMLDYKLSAKEWHTYMLEVFGSIESAKRSFEDTYYGIEELHKLWAEINSIEQARRNTLFKHIIKAGYRDHKKP